MYPYVFLLFALFHSFKFDSFSSPLFENTIFTPSLVREQICIFSRENTHHVDGYLLYMMKICTIEVRNK